MTFRHPTIGVAIAITPLTTYIEENYHAALTANEIRSRVESDWNRIVKVLSEKVALQSISAKGITAEHMKRSAEFVADELRLVGVDARWSRLPMPTALRAWEVIGSHIVSPDALTVLLYAHHDVQPVPDPPSGTPTRSWPPKLTAASTAVAPPMTAAVSPSIPVH